jgi:hypothetical protein
MKFSFSTNKNQAQAQVTAPAASEEQPQTQSSPLTAEALAELQTKELEHGFRLDCGELDKGEVSIAHMKVSGMVKGTEVVMSGDTFPNAAIFRSRPTPLALCLFSFIFFVSSFFSVYYLAFSYPHPHPLIHSLSLTFCGLSQDVRS